MNNNTFVHKYIKPLITNEDITIDMTIGNGNDTQFLSSLSKYVYGFDINPIAIDNTRKRITNDNVKLILDNHINVDKYIQEKVKLVIFNLGYLPNSDHSTITKTNETLIAFKKSYDLLVTNGYLIITFYLGQDGGKQEYELLKDYIEQNNICVLQTYTQNKVDSPITYIIKKLV